MSALERAAGALLVLQSALLREEEPFLGFCRSRALRALLALQADGVSETWLDAAIAGVGDVSLPAWKLESVAADALVCVDDALTAEAEAEMLATSASEPAAAPADGHGDVSSACLGRRHGDCSAPTTLYGAPGNCPCVCHVRAARAPESRPETPPPPSGRGDEEAEEHAAARDQRDTLPPLAEAFAADDINARDTVEV